MSEILHADMTRCLVKIGFEPVGYLKFSKDGRILDLSQVPPRMLDKIECLVCRGASHETVVSVAESGYVLVPA